MKKWLLLLWLWPTASFAQLEGQGLIDSLKSVLPRLADDSTKVNALNKIAFQSERIDPISGIRYAKQSIALSKKIGWPDGLAEAYRTLGINYVGEANFKEALKCYNTARHTTTNKVILSKIMRNIGLVYTYQSDYKNAMIYHMKALRMSEEVGDKRGVAAVLSNMGIVYYDLQQYPKAIEHYEKARKINEQMGNQAFLSNNLGNLGNSYSALKQYATAIEYYKKAIVINDALGNIGNKSINLGALGSMHYQMRQYDEAIHYINQAEVLARQLHDDRNIAHAVALLGDIYLAKAKSAKSAGERATWLEKSQHQFETVMPMDKSMMNFKEIASNYLQMAEIASLSGKYQDALSYYKQGSKFKDSVFNQDTRETIKNLEDKRAIELRDKEIQLNKATLQSQKRAQWLYVSGIGFLLIIAGLVFWQSRNRKKRNEELNRLNDELALANNTKTRFFSILNHDLRSPVSNLINFLHLQKESPELLDAQSKQRMEQKTITSAENLLDSMEDLLLWSKGQMENFKPVMTQVSVAAVFHDLGKYFSGVEQVQLQFINPENLLLHTDENYLKTILRNLINNAVKALEKTPHAQILVRAQTQSGQLQLLVQDNGPGGSVEKFKALYDEKQVVGIKTGLGLHLIRDLAKAIDCQISVETSEGKGTTFTLQMP